jgi:hypothetical protein
MMAGKSCAAGEARLGVKPARLSREELGEHDRSNELADEGALKP